MSERDREQADCEEALQELYVFLDGELTVERREIISGHLHDCSPCLETYDFQAELKAVLARRCVDTPPAELRERIARALSDLRAEG